MMFRKKDLFKKVTFYMYQYCTNMYQSSLRSHQWNLETRFS